LSKADKFEVPEVSAVTKEARPVVLKNKSLLSFEEEEEEPVVKKGISSLHDALAGKDSSLSTQAAVSASDLAEQRAKK
jgi:hypothetical protein